MWLNYCDNLNIKRHMRKRQLRWAMAARRPYVYTLVRTVRWGKNFIDKYNFVFLTLLKPFFDPFSEFKILYVNMVMRADRDVALSRWKTALWDGDHMWHTLSSAYLCRVRRCENFIWFFGVVANIIFDVASQSCCSEISWDLAQSFFAEYEFSTVSCVLKADFKSQGVNDVNVLKNVRLIRPYLVSNYEIFCIRKIIKTPQLIIPNNQSTFT